MAGASANPGGATAGVDGRTVRRQRNRDAAVDAMLALYDAGQLTPSMADVAEAAGLSPRSLFRYFDDVDDLVRAAVARQQQRLAPLATLDVDPAAPLVDRIETVVAQRIRLVEAMGNVGRVARRCSHEQPPVAAELDRQRRDLRRQLARAFAAELADRPPDLARSLLATAEVLCSWEAHDQYRRGQGLSSAATARALRHALEALFTTPR